MGASNSFSDSFIAGAFFVRGNARPERIQTGAACVLFHAERFDEARPGGRGSFRLRESLKRNCGPRTACGFGQHVKASRRSGNIV